MALGTRLARREEFGRSEGRSEEHTSELQSLRHLVCRLLLEKKKNKDKRLSEPILRRAAKIPEEEKAQRLDESRVRATGHEASGGHDCRPHRGNQLRTERHT